MLLVIVFLCTYPGANNVAQTQPDPNFKSIHQLQSEVYKKDTITDTVRIKPAEQNKQQKKIPKGIFNTKQPMQTIINFSLMVILIVALIISLSIFLITRRIYRTKK